jgi:hypothetical protein
MDMAFSRNQRLFAFIVTRLALESTEFRGKALLAGAD